MPAAAPGLEETVYAYAGNEEFTRQFQDRIVVEIKAQDSDGRVLGYECGRLMNTDPAHFPWVTEEYLDGDTDCTFTFSFYSPWDGSGVGDCWPLLAGEQAIVAKDLDLRTAKAVTVAIVDFVRIACQCFIFSQTATDQPESTKRVVDRFLARTGVPLKLSLTPLHPEYWRIDPYWDVDGHPDWRPATGPRT